MDKIETNEDKVMTVIDVMDGARTQMFQLAEVSQALNDAKNQVKSSAQVSHERLEGEFTRIKTVICNSLDNRLNKLLKEIKDIESTALKPLEECDTMIKDSTAQVQCVLAEGKEILANDPDNHIDVVAAFKQKSEKMGPISLPEIPSLSEVVYISVDVPSGLENTVIPHISEFCDIHSKAPVQLTELLERPGSLLVNWVEVDDDCDLSIAEFRLQCCSGQVTCNTANNNNFFDVYRGPLTAHIVRNLKINVIYSFRVCCRYENEKTWSAWSIPVSSKTMLTPYEWATNDSSFLITNDGRGAVKNTTTVQNVLYSKDPSYMAGHLLQFQIVEMAASHCDDCIGLSISNDNNYDTLRRIGALCVDMQGTVFIDNQEMSTKLPSLVEGSFITFVTEAVGDEKLRVTIETDNKAVTFDWKIEDQELSVDKCNLFFGVKFSIPGWKVIVE